MSVVIDGTTGVTAAAFDGAVDGADLTGTVSASLLTGALPALNGSALTNLPAPTSAQVGTATAGLAVGDVGTYIWAACSGLISFGDTRAGSNLSPAGLFSSANWPQGAPASSGATVNSADTGYAPYGGTWRCMGSSLNYTAYPARARMTLFLRIS